MRRFGFLLALAAATFGAQTASALPTVDLRHVTIADGKVTAPSGNGSARLSLDPKWQRTAERLLTASRAPEGAIVVSDVRTGKILAWATHGPNHDYVSTPFAPSASLFKVVTATALLEAGRANPSTKQCYSGGEHDVRPQDLTHTGGPECATLGDALAQSINLVFARLALKHLSAGELKRSATALGFGSETLADIAAPRSEVAIPDDPIGMARAAAGFGEGRLSPLAALAMMQTVANGGERIRLSVLADSPSRLSMGRAMTEKTANELRQMLEGTVTRGTCARAFHRPDGTRYLPHTAVAAKTGTLVTGKPSRMFSWFGGFAPSNKPQIAIAVMLGNDVKWWEKANEVGRDFLRAYFDEGGARGSIAHR